MKKIYPTFISILFTLYIFFIVGRVISEPAQPMRMCAEWEPARGILITYPPKIPASLVVELAKDDTLYTLVKNNSQQNAAVTLYNSWSVNLEHCQFIYSDHYSCWTRDWGPQYVFDGDGNLGIADPIFDGYPWVPGGMKRGISKDWGQDDIVNVDIAQYFNCALHELPAYFTGGNVMTDGHGYAFSTEQMLDENSDLWDPSAFKYQVNLYTGIDNYNFISNIEDYGIQHIDCAAKLLDEETILVKELPIWHPDYDRIETVVDELESLENCYGRHYNIVRIFCDSYDGNSVAAYTNSLILNGKVLVPLFGISSDSTALQTYENAMPGYEVLGFYYNDPSHPWYYYDALHCRTMGIFDRNMLRLTHKRLNPQVPYQDQYEIKSYIHDYSNAGLLQDNLKVMWRIQGEVLWNDEQLVEIAGTDSFYSFIPCQNIGTKVQYYLTACDSSGRSETLPPSAPQGFYEFTVIENSIENEPFRQNILFQNYPNPININTNNLSQSGCKTTIFYELKNDSKVSLKIYNIKGKFIKKLINERKNAGIHNIIWRGKNYRSEIVKPGLYLYKLEIKSEKGLNEAFYKKMILTD